MEKTQKQKHWKEEFGEVYDRILSMTLMNNALMTKVFEDQKCVELILQIIMSRKDIHVIHSQVQQQITNLQGRSVILDILASDLYGNTFNVEIQKTDTGAMPERARYHSALLDANLLEPGDTFEMIQNSYVIFITENDVIGSNLPIYHMERVILENGKLLNDGSHIIYVNGKIIDETELGKLMHDFQCTDYEEMRYDVLKDRVRYFKNEREGIISMKEIVEDWEFELFKRGKKEGIEQGIEQGIERKNKSIVRKMKEKNYSEEQISELLEISINQVKEYLEESR